MWSEDGREITLRADDIIQTETEFIANERLTNDLIIDKSIEQHIKIITDRIFENMCTIVKNEVDRNAWRD